MDLTPYRVNFFNDPSPMNIIPTSSPSLQPLKHKIRDVSTPSPNRLRTVSFPMMHRVQMESRSVRLPEEPTTDSSSDKNDSQDIDKIQSNLTKVMSEIREIGLFIGFTNDDFVSQKKDLMNSINLTMTKAVSALNREKTTLQQECDYARQQVQLILSLMGDPDGNELLNSRDRSFIFQEKENGFENRPMLTLRQLRSTLNLIFLSTFRPFVGLLKLVVVATSKYHLCRESIGDWIPSLADSEFLANLPTHQEAEHFMKLIRKFEEIVERFDTSRSHHKTLGNENQHNMSILVSSPRKLAHHDTPQIPNPVNIDHNIAIISELREINYEIIRALRVTKMTRVSSPVSASLERIAAQCNEEMESRSLRMVSILTHCLDQIKEMDLSDNDIFKIQKSYDTNSSDKPPDDASYFDKGTLSFIRDHPRQFGFHDQHLNFIENFAGMLENFRQSRQSEIDDVKAQCTDLWTRLGEDSSYIERFTTVNHKLCQSSIMNYKIELNKLHKKRAESIDRFISETRQQIELLWQKMFYTCDKQASFEYYDESSMQNVENKEAVLAIHEQTLADLKLEYESKKQILDQYDQLNSLIDDQMFLVESSKDSSRLMSKDSCRILLNEEKTRNRVERNMPRLFDSIKRGITEYDRLAKEKGQETFMYFEKSLLEKVDEMQQMALPTSGSTRGTRKVLLSRSPVRKPSLSRPSPVKAPGRVQGKLLLPVRVNAQVKTGLYGRDSTYARSALPIRSAMSQGTQRTASHSRPAPRLNPAARIQSSSRNARQEFAANDSSSASSLASPLQSQDRVNHTSTLALSLVLQPLNFDCTPRHDLLPMPSSSPLRLNKLMNHANLPVANARPVEFHETSDQENVEPNMMHESKLQKPFVLHSRNNNVLATINADDTTVYAEDEYQTWRAARIKKLNGF